jgi:hypothetical protein
MDGTRQGPHRPPAMQLCKWRTGRSDAPGRNRNPEKQNPAGATTPPTVPRLTTGNTGGADPGSVRHTTWVRRCPGTPAALPRDSITVAVRRRGGGALGGSVARRSTRSRCSLPTGIPKFYRWLSERYPLLNQRITATEGPPEVDNLYLDMNGIIHNCTHANQAEVKLNEVGWQPCLWALGFFIFWAAVLGHRHQQELTEQQDLFGGS